MTQGEEKKFPLMRTHQLFDSYRQGFHEKWRRPEFACGWGAAFLNICVTFPINKVMFRQQLHGVRLWKALRQIQTEGVAHLYRGLMPPLLQKTTSMSIMFGLYYEFQRDFEVMFPSMWSPVNKSIAAILAGTMESVLTPFERVQVLMQDTTYHKHYGNTLHAFSEIRQTHGIKEFYRGQTAILFRNGFSNVLFFLGRDYLHMVYPADETWRQKILLDFVSGACLGAFLSTLFYPLNVVKVRLQSKVGGEFQGVVTTFRVILQERNYSMKKLFRGVHVNYTRAFISWGIVNATYEFLMKQARTSGMDDDT